MVPRPEAKPEYYAYLVAFMSFRDGVAYTKASVFTNAQLATIQPEEIKRWMCLKVFGNADPGHDDNPTKGRSSLL
jgi:hypothetical protein